MRRALAAIDGRDLLAAFGWMLIAIGLALVSVPTALVVCGTILLLLAVWPVIVQPRRGGG